MVRARARATVMVMIMVRVRLKIRIGLVLQRLKRAQGPDGRVMQRITYSL